VEIKMSKREREEKTTREGRRERVRKPCWNLSPLPTLPSQYKHAHVATHTCAPTRTRWKESEEREE
jgi:hypothetical protein